MNMKFPENHPSSSNSAEIVIQKYEKKVKECMEYFDTYLYEEAKIAFGTDEKDSYEKFKDELSKKIFLRLREIY